MNTGKRLATKGTKSTKGNIKNFVRSLLCFLCLLWLISPVPSFAQLVLNRFEVIRVDSQDIERVPGSLRQIFADPLPDAEVVNNLTDATTRAGFTPRLPKSDKPQQVGVISPTSVQLKINVAELRTALNDAKATGVVVPDAWDGLTMNLQQRAGVFVDFGDFFIAQAPARTLSADKALPVEEFIEVLLRVLGMDAMQARNLRQAFAAAPAGFFPIPKRFEMDIHAVKLRTGSGLFLQNGSKQGEVALAWSDADRTYFLSGFVTESQATGMADALQ
jgi:hypothetical protein